MKLFSADNRNYLETDLDRKIKDVTVLAVKILKDSKAFATVSATAPNIEIRIGARISDLELDFRFNCKTNILTLRQLDFKGEYPTASVLNDLGRKSVELEKAISLLKIEA